MNLQAELAYVQAHLSTFTRLPPLPPPQSQSPSPTNHHHCTSDLVTSSDLQHSLSMQFDPIQPQPTSTELTSYFDPLAEELENGDVQALARELISRYLPGVRFRASSPH